MVYWPETVAAATTTAEMPARTAERRLESFRVRCRMMNFLVRDVSLSENRTSLSVAGGVDFRGHHATRGAGIDMWLTIKTPSGGARETPAVRLAIHQKLHPEV